METMVLQPRKLPERRVAIMWITTGAFFSLLASIKGGRFWLPVFRDLPDDARPLEPGSDCDASAFGVMIESPSLPVVLDGEPAPCLKPLRKPLSSASSWRMGLFMATAISAISAMHFPNTSYRLADSARAEPDVIGRAHDPPAPHLPSHPTRFPGSQASRGISSRISRHDSKRTSGSCRSRGCGRWTIGPRGLTAARDSSVRGWRSGRRQTARRVAVSRCSGTSLTCAVIG